jgi:hypothetical protein
MFGKEVLIYVLRLGQYDTRMIKHWMSLLAKAYAGICTAQIDKQHTSSPSQAAKTSASF